MAAVTRAPPTHAASLVRTEVRRDGVGVITIDDPDAIYNTLTPALGAELGAALDALDADGRVTAIVVRGKPGSFLVGANLDFLRAVRFAEDATDASREAAKRFLHLADGAKPVVACVHGPALGGGMELALACTATVATDHETTLLGLPEVKLGLVPAANGLLRVAERAGLRVALDLGLSGRGIRANKARAWGLVDEVVAPAIALDTACALANKLAERPEYRKVLPRKRAWVAHHGLGAVQHALLEKNPLGRALVLRRARAASATKTRGHYPATDRMLDVLERWSRWGFASAAELEATRFGELVVSETSHRLVDLFFAGAALKKDSGLEPGERAEGAVVSSVAVVGAGLMGAGIACATVQAGIAVRMKDRDDHALGRGLKYVKDLLDARVERGSISLLERDQTLSRLSGAIDYSGLRHADVVIEAVFEDLALKHTVIREVEKRVPPSCVIATNTSTLPVASIAAAATHPERVVGMHYLRPVHQVPLLEVVRTPSSDPRAIATAVALGRRQGKTVIVVRDGTAFYTTRILTPYLNEAVRLLGEGVAVEAIDDALVDWGFSTGPLELLDELGVDAAARVASVTATAFGERMRPPDALAALARDHRGGRSNGRGFYLYGHGGERRVDDTVYAAVGLGSGGVPRDPRRGAMVITDEISLRCALAMVNEALRCLEDGVLRSARDGDVAAVLGLGFPAFRGGPFRYVDALGPAELLQRTRSLEQRHGARFSPAPLLVEMARKAKRFYG